MRTSGSGYLTRRLIDVAQDVITREDDCGTLDGSWIADSSEKTLLPPLAKRIIGRMAADKIVHPETGDIIVERNQEIDEIRAAEIVTAKITKVYVRSPLSCQSRWGVCRMCYGRDLARGKLVDPNTAVGIIAAQSIGEPGTQLTLRTFHTGGIIGLDITTGLPRVEELFEARTPKAQALMSEIDGIAEITQDEEGRRIKITNSQILTDEYLLPDNYQIMVDEGTVVEGNTILASQVPPPKKKGDKTEATEVTRPSISAQRGGEVILKDGKICIKYEEKEEREYVVSVSAQMRIKSGDKVDTGMQLTEGSLNPQDLMRILGRHAVQQYMVEEVQKVYRSQGVNINDKHIETISRQMLTQVRITSSGDTKLIPGEIVDRFHYEDSNAKVLSEGGEPSTALPILLGITRASLNTDSWLAAASFQETTRVLTEAAVYSKVDKLIGLKENVIIGKLIPAHNPAARLTEPIPAAAVVAATNTAQLLQADIIELEDDLPEEDSQYGD